MNLGKFTKRSELLIFLGFAASRLYLFISIKRVVYACFALIPYGCINRLPGPILRQEFIKKEVTALRTIRYLLIAIMTGASMLTAGCFSWYDYNSASNYGSKRDYPQQNTSRAYQTQQQYSPVSHKVTKLEMNQFLSDQVAAMNGVSSAIVMMGDNTAYTAITFDGTAFGTSGRNGSSGGSTETNNYGLVKGLYNPGDPLNDYANPDDLISGVSGAQTQMHHERLSHMFKQKIAEKIRSLDPTVKDVYISANRVVVNEFNRFAQESWHGRSLEPYREQFIQLMTLTFGTNPTIPNQSEASGREY